MSAANERARQEQLIGEFEMRRKMKNAVVPTDDGEVRAMLRNVFRVPVTLFGEDMGDRRERLKREVARAGADAPVPMDEDASAAAAGGPAAAAAAAPAELFYTEGGAALRRARLLFAEFSTRRAGTRTAQQRSVLRQIRGAARKHARRPARRQGPDRAAEEDGAREEPEELEGEALDRSRAAFAALVAATDECGDPSQNVRRRLSRMEIEASEVGDERPISCCACSDDGAAVVTAGWSGAAKVWGIAGGAGGSGVRLERAVTVAAHADRVTGLAWHPHAPGAAADDGAGAADRPAFMTASSDATARVWGRGGRLLRTFAGHLDRQAKCAFHPAGTHAATTSFDKTWRLWDVEVGEEVLLQEGHSRGVYCVSFHPDGSLALSAGLDAMGIVWDLRTGRSCMRLEGHVKHVLATDMAPNGVFASTGGADNTVRLWDLRRHGKELYTVPAHSSLITACSFERGHGRFLLTSSFDASAKLWSTARMEPVAELAGHEGKVMGADFSVGGGGAGDTDVVVTVSSDKTVKLWAPRGGVCEDGDGDGDGADAETG